MAKRKSSDMERGIYAPRLVSSKGAMVPAMETAPQGCVPFAPTDLDRFFDEPEGAEAGVELVDAHVHLFPDRVYDALYRWFEKHAWRCRYRLYAEQVVDH